MRRAITLSKRRLGRTHPNPTVGCVIVRDGCRIGEGTHRGPGAPHAEIEALQACGNVSPRGADCYVTLEPCNHTGRTPPCTDALIRAGIRRVVIAVRDPNPGVPGGGAERLRDAGIAVETGLLAEDARAVLAPWLKWIVTGKPHVVLKLATSLDGHVATRSGDSRWITGEASRRLVHRVRARVDGIMAGAGTVRCDDPALTARRGDRVIHSPVRIIVDRCAELPATARVFRQDMPGKTLWAVPKDRVKFARQSVPNTVQVLGCPVRPDGFDLPALMAELGTGFGLESILLEGGPDLAFAMLEQGCVDAVMFFIAPVLIGGREAPAALGGSGFDPLNRAVRLEHRRIRKIGDDVLIEGCPGNRLCSQESSGK